MPDYLLGTGGGERERLRHQHEVWREDTERLWKQAEFGRGQTILDLGSGPGYTTIDLAKIVERTGRIIALDASQSYVEFARRLATENALDNIEVRIGDVRAEHYGVSVFDGVFVRWLLCFLSDHERVVRKAAAALKPGGKLVTLEYFNYLAVDLEPRSGRFEHMFRSIHRSFFDAGGDLDVGGKLPPMMRKHGLEIEHIIPVIRIGRPGSPVWLWVTEFFEFYLPDLVEHGYVTRKELDDFDREWRERAQDPGSFFCSPPMVGVIATKSLGRIRHRFAGKIG